MSSHICAPRAALRPVAVAGARALALRLAFSSLALAVATACTAACTEHQTTADEAKPAEAAAPAPSGGGVVADHAAPGEKRLRNVRKLTAGGENAEAYLAFDERRLAFQSTRPPFLCDQIFVMGIDGSAPTLVSSGKGRTTCAYFLPDGKRVLYASTHLGGDDCPPKPDHSKGYVWPLYPSFDIFVADLEGGPLTRLTDTPGYDAEATVSPVGDRIVFTSVRDGDIDLYSMKLDGSDVHRLTSELGYDGGAFFSRDGKQIVYRTMRPETEAEIADYQRLLAEGLVRPTKLELFVMDADGSNKRQVTKLGKASFAPFFHPDGQRIIFSSNLDDPRGREFDLYLIRTDGTGLERITFAPAFDGFPMFTRDGKRLVFCSNRGGAAAGETNVFVADWVD